METAILGMTIIVVLFGTIVTGALLWMTLKGDYSLLFRQDQNPGGPPETPPSHNGSLDLAVAHFVKETAGWTASERSRVARDLEELRTRPPGR